MPFILLILVVTVILFGPYIAPEHKSMLYAVSLSIKSLIIFFLPFIIFGLLFKTANGFTSNATKIILMVLFAVCCSNFISTIVSQYVGKLVYNFGLTLPSPSSARDLKPYWSINLPQLIPNNIAMFLGLSLGIVTSLLSPKVASKITNISVKIVSFLLSIFNLLIPIFVAGFVMKLEHDGAINIIFRDYGPIFIIIAIAQFSYIGLIYFIANKFNLDRMFSSIKNMLPAAIAGFSTMSSAAAMPLTILGTEKNSSKSSIASSIIPATVNIHLIGDCFAIPIFAFAILKNYGIAEPSIISYMIFAGYFVLAKFSVAAIPGGGIIVMLPILEAYLGFNASMMSLITALYILFDPVITCANVLGNGGFSLMIRRLIKNNNEETVANPAV
jgi:Na+/H+-dicarboxylate symporter